MSLVITVLVDNQTQSAELRAAAGLALHIQDQDIAVLFDTGTDARVIAHAEALGIDLGGIDAIMLSHGHHDHTGGLPALAAFFAARGRRPPLIAHPGVWQARWVRDRPELPERWLGPPLDLAAASSGFDWRPATSACAVGKMIFIGEVPPCAERATLGVVRDAHGDHADSVIDDSGLAWRGRDGLVVVSGCAHSGIESLIDHAHAVSGEPRLAAVVGGMHLQSADEARIAQVQRYLGARAPRRVHACHCTGAAAARLPFQQGLGVGAVLRFD